LTCNDHTAGDAALFPAGEIILVNFTVNELEHVHGCGKIVAFADVENRNNGRSSGKMATDCQSAKVSRQGWPRWPCILLRNELMTEIGREVLRLYQDGVTIQLPDELDWG